LVCGFIVIKIIKMKRSSLRFFLLVFTMGVFTFGAQAQNTISGKITDTDGEPLIGANVSIKGTVTGTSSDLNGAFTLDSPDKNPTLVISYTGYQTMEYAVTDASTNVSLEEDVSTLSDVIVSTTRIPIRKLETTTAVDVISEKIIEAARPEGISEAIQGTAGVYTSQSQGRFRGGIFIRGFPDGSGNGLVYTGVMLDGLPSQATPARPPDFAFGMDPNVEKVEVVRGSAATLFGRAAAAGVINVITRTGGEKHSGMVRLTNYNRNVDSRSGFDMKGEFNVNGPISENFRYNIGGYYVNDRGFRDMGYNDRGGQLRANFDYLMGDKGSIRLSAGYVNVSIQNMIDIPYRLSDNKPMDGWETTDSYYSTALDEYTSPLNGFLDIPDGHIQITDTDGNAQNRSIQAANEDGNYARGMNLGLRVNYNITDNFEISNNLRYQNYDHGTKFNLGVSTFYFNDPNDSSLPVNFRILIDGDGNDTEIMDELRLTYKANLGNSTHRFSLGTYLSNGKYSPETYSWFHLLSAEPDDPAFGFFGDLLDGEGNPILLPDSTTISVPTTVGASPVPFGSAARRDEYNINVTSFFFGDEMKFGSKTTVNAGVRYDKVSMDLSGFYGDDATDIRNRKESHSDFSASVGVNQLLGDRSAVYGNFVSAFRMPDYSAYSPVDPASYNAADPPSSDNPPITDNERITNFEVGYRTGVSDLGIDVAGFYTNIANRLATVYEGAIAVQRPLGTNLITGGELALTYSPASVKGLLVRGGFTYQSATFQDFIIPIAEADPAGNLFDNSVVDEGNDNYSIDLKGNQVPRIPSTLLNLSVNYDSDYFGANAQLNYFGNRYADATNIYKMDDMTNVNLGIYGRFPLSNGSGIKLSLLAKNLINTDNALRFLYVSDNDAALARAQSIDAGTNTAANSYYTGIPFLPRRILISLAYEF